jgi:hypothetical protein
VSLCVLRAALPHLPTAIHSTVYRLKNGLFPFVAEIYNPYPEQTHIIEIFINKPFFFFC